jgi:hypothetical protein
VLLVWRVPAVRGGLEELALPDDVHVRWIEGSLQLEELICFNLQRLLEEARTMGCGVFQKGRVTHNLAGG